MSSYCHVYTHVLVFNSLRWDHYRRYNWYAWKALGEYPYDTCNWPMECNEKFNNNYTCICFKVKIINFCIRRKCEKYWINI